MEAEFPQSAREAEEHIRQIRRDKGLGDGHEQIGNNASDLESALELLSKDLYQTTTHFLLELIQNADDNFYKAEIPTLSITYSPGRVRIDCNERGFEKKHIEAICRICKSTKMGRNKSAGFVGEKGIGFKAVFKVASTVWISSGHYSFRFDRDSHLGMIAPIWDKFPEKPREACTSILLKLARDCDEKNIINQLESYDERMLLFLRRLQKIEIDVTPKSSFLSRSSPFQTCISRHSQTSDNPSMTILAKNGSKKSYLVWRHTANKMPTESRRPNISSSEIVLAFPNTGIEGNVPLQPVIESQNVYAFLPIRDSGLPFLLQADFLLPASREDIYVDSPWNKVLAARAAVAFIGAIRHMGDLDNSLRYSWIRYIPTTQGKTKYIEDLRLDIFKRLQNSKILDSQSGRKRKPASIIRAPIAWCDRSGRPFMIHRSNKRKFLDTQYNVEQDHQYLDMLGVKVMDEKFFFDEIVKITGRDTAPFFRNKTKEWHASFARALASMSTYRLRSLAIIPLLNGKWASVNSAGSPIYFPRKSVSAIPQGIEINIVDPRVAADPDWRRLLAKIGVIDLSDSHIGGAIRNTHQNNKFKPATLGSGALVSHAEFLFKARATYFSDPFLIWMATDQGSYRKSDTIYLPLKDVAAAYNVLPNGTAKSQKYGFLHNAYLQTGGSDKSSWFAYLQRSHQVSVYPRFFNDSPDKKYNCAWGEHIHADFKLLMQGSLNQKCLILLRDGWEFYKEWLDFNPQKYDHRTPQLTNLLSFLRDSRAPCTGSVQSEQVKFTYMPYDRLTRDYGTVAPFLDIPNPQDPRWNPLMKRLLVGMENDIDFYLKCLSGAKRNVKFPDGKIREIMHEIEDRLDATDGSGTVSLPLVQNTIANDNLIYISPGMKGEGVGEERRGSWVSPYDCFWRGDSWLTQSVRLESLYPDLESFFRKHLLVPNSGIEHLIREAGAIRQFAQPIGPQIKRLFLAFTAHVKVSGLDSDERKRIQQLEMFPIVSTPKNEPYEYLASITSKQPWLIADRANFRVQFKHVIPVLAFSPEFVLKIKPFLVTLGLKERFLSERATSITEALGDDVELHHEITKRYRSRSKYFFRLIPENQTDEKQLREKFRDVEVYIAPKIVQYWRAPLGLREVQSEPADGDAFLEFDYAGDLRIYLRKGYENESYPYELVEQLRNFFNVPFEQRDLLAAAMISPEERVDEHFEKRGIAPLFDEETAEGNGDDESVLHAPILHQGTNKKRQLRLGDSRFSRLFSHKRFSDSFVDQTAGPSNSLPSYHVAVARATQGAIGRPIEPRTFGSPHTLRSLGVSLKNLEFEQQSGAVVATARSPPTVWDRIWGWKQRDFEVGETIVSHILSQVLSAQYDRAQMWTPQGQRKHRAAFNFIDKQGRFSSFLMRLDGMSGNAQGYTRFIYHMDVKATDTEVFEITQAELDRAREHSVHSQPSLDEQAASKHVSILVHISDVRKEPRIRFLADPWDLFEDGQLILENSRTYRARLKLRLHPPPESATNADAGFDTVQIRPHQDPDRDDTSPEYEDGKKEQKTPEMSTA